MATYATLTINAADIVGADFDRSRANAVIEWGGDDGVIDAIKVDNTEIRLGSRREYPDATGNIVFANLVTTNSASNPTSFYYRVTITYTPKGSRKQGHDTWTSGWFPLTATTNAASIDAFWDPVASPVTWRSDFRDEMQGVRDEAVAARDLAVDISNIDSTDTAVAAGFQIPGSTSDAYLASTYGRGISVTDPRFGATGDGTTDDTAAIQAAIDAAAPGQQIYFPETGSGSFYKITDTLTITTPSIRLVGQPRDGYAMSIRCAVASKVMIEVKAAGFVMQDIALWGDVAATNGAGATVTGLDLYGTPAGDVDTLVNGCTFQYLALGVKCRGRNLTVERTLFSNCLNGVLLDGAVVGYHPDAANVHNRGNLIRGNRFHNIGTDTTHAAIRAPAADNKILHATIENNHFDSNGEGKHIWITGKSGTSHERLFIIDNKHTELRAAGVQLDYVNNSVVRGAFMVGDASIFRDYIGLVFNNCNTVRVENVFGLQFGTHGLYARNCTYLRVRDVDFRALGINNTGTGNGFDIDSTNTEVDLDGVTVESTDGWGLIGSPVSSRLGDYKFTSCALGDISSLVFGRDSIFLAASSLDPYTGSPNLTGVPGVGYPVSWQLDAAAVEALSGALRIPDSWRSFDIEVVWAPTNGGAGDVQFQAAYNYLRPGFPVSDGAVSASVVNATSPAVAARVVQTTVASGLARQPYPLVVRLLRVATAGADTYAADAAIVGIRLVRTT